jgi:hypothetical protein
VKVNKVKYATQPSVGSIDYPSYASPQVKRRDEQNVYSNNMAFKTGRDSIDSVKPRGYYLTNKGSPY